MVTFGQLNYQGLAAMLEVTWALSVCAQGIARLIAARSLSFGIWIIFVTIGVNVTANKCAGSVFQPLAACMSPMEVSENVFVHDRAVQVQSALWMAVPVHCFLKCGKSSMPDRWLGEIWEDYHSARRNTRCVCRAGSKWLTQQGKREADLGMQRRSFSRVEQCQCGYEILTNANDTGRGDSEIAYPSTLISVESINRLSQRPVTLLQGKFILLSTSFQGLLCLINGISHRSSLPIEIINRSPRLVGCGLSADPHRIELSLHSSPLLSGIYCVGNRSPRCYERTKSNDAVRINCEEPVAFVADKMPTTPIHQDANRSEHRPHKSDRIDESLPLVVYQLIGHRVNTVAWLSGGWGPLGEVC